MINLHLSLATLSSWIEHPRGSLVRNAHTFRHIDAFCLTKRHISTLLVGEKYFIKIFYFVSYCLIIMLFCASECGCLRIMLLAEGEMLLKASTIRLDLEIVHQVNMFHSLVFRMGSLCLKWHLHAR